MFRVKLISNRRLKIFGKNFGITNPEEQIIEPSCAVPLAALLANQDRFAGKKVGIILSGGNVDLGKLPF